jgi:putative transcriptional regulator
MRNRVAELREQRGWTQVELADLIGVTTQTVNAIEQNLYTPTLLLAFDIAEALNTNIAEVFPPELRRLPLDQSSRKPWYHRLLSLR